MSFFRRFLFAWRYAERIPSLRPLDHEDAWKAQDSIAYTAFMESPTGQKLKARCTALIIQSAVNSTQASQHAEHRCGWASGIAATFTWLDGHRSQAEPEQEQTETEQPDAAARYRP